jgi:hypothetical protein
MNSLRQLSDSRVPLAAGGTADPPTSASEDYPALREATTAAVRLNSSESGLLDFSLDEPHQTDLCALGEAERVSAMLEERRF